MIKKVFALSVFAIACNLAIAQTIDYTSYELAKKYKLEDNTVLAYKYLMIFKYTNLSRLRESKNRNALLKLDAQLDALENLLMQTVDWYSVRKGNGFTTKQIDSVRRISASKIIFYPINIQ